jgi:hypothetical protein
MAGAYIDKPEQLISITSLKSDRNPLVVLPWLCYLVDPEKYLTY